MGDLSVEQTSADGVKTLFYQYGDQGKDWHQAKVDVVSAGKSKVWYSCKLSYHTFYSFIRTLQ